MLGFFAPVAILNEILNPPILAIIHQEKTLCLTQYHHSMIKE
ncbi:hypothetical protein VIBNIFTn2_120147 [Vibrio nigripulchritudo FTn2]|nr:hypothetical protein VIBNIFTn2_120147 [Vibrio nigripulchritudo FTn2]